MDLDASNLKEKSRLHSSSGSDNAAVEGKGEEQMPASAATEVDGAEPEQPLQHARTLGKMRFRPADDDEPQ